MMTRIPTLPAVLCAGTAALLSACAPTTYERIESNTFGDTKRKLVESVPVVDVHTHTFNSRFLPLRGIALAKRELLGGFFKDTSDARILALVDLITRMTGKSKLPAEHVVNAEIAAAVSAIPKVRDITAEEVAADPGIKGARKLLDYGKEIKDLTEDERSSLTEFAKLFDEHAEDSGIGMEMLSRDQLESMREYWHFMTCLTKREDQLEDRFQSDHKTRINLAVSHMMDLAPTYNQEEDGERLYSIRDQIPRMQRQQQHADGKLLYFVAYNPFRDTWTKDPKSADGKAREIVQDAYEKKGAFGVKVYPPSGYRPAGNEIPDKPTSKAAGPLEQWRARYEPEGRPAVTPQDLDRRLLDLCVWAAKNQVPIFVHCGQGEFKAQPGNEKMAHPKAWKMLLDRNKEQLGDLRLCLGHAGGGEEWYRAGNPANWDEDSDWGKTVYELCRDYKNVYCEFGCHHDIANPDKRENFTANLKKLIAASREPAPTGTKHYDFAEKIMYGSDWFMPMTHASDRLNYLLAFKSAVYDAGSNPEESEALCRDFCYRNSLEFLNVDERIAKGDLPWKLVKNLEELKSNKPKKPIGR